MSKLALPVVSLALTLLAAPAAHAGLEIDASVSYAVGSSMGAAVTSGDFNHDGRTDLATVPRYGGAAASILLGRGDGTFASRTIGDTGGLSMATGDLNGDGKLDIAVPGWTSSATILYGNGDGTFAAPVSVGTTTSSGAPGGVASIAIGQLGGSEPGLDVAVTNGDGLQILLGRGDGAFPAQLTYRGWEASEIVLGNFTGDGHADVALTRFVGTSTGAITILPGSATGEVGAPIVTPIDRPVGSPVAYDDDGDGLLDIVVADRSMYATEVGIFYGVGDGTFELLAAADVGGYPSALAVGDLDGDDRPDVLTASGEWLTTWFDSGELADARYSADTRDLALGLAVADFDRDGFDDAAISTYAGRVIVARNAPGLDASPANGLTFGAGGALQTVTVTNTGAPDLRIGAVTVEGAQDFTVGGSCIGATVRGGGACSLAVAFTARGPGQRTATLVITGNQAGGAKRIALTGTGTGAAPQPAAPKDTTAPSLTATTPRQRLATVLRRGLALRYRCSEACSVRATATVDARTARRLGLSRAAGPTSSGACSRPSPPTRRRRSTFGSAARAHAPSPSSARSR